MGASTVGVFRRGTSAGGGASGDTFAPLASSVTPCSVVVPFFKSCLVSTFFTALSWDVLTTSREPRGEEVSLGASFNAGLAGPILSIDVRLAASRLWRGLPCAERGFWPAVFAAMARASLSWSRSFARVLEEVLEGPARNPYCQKPTAFWEELQSSSIPGDCFTGEAGGAGLASFVCAEPSLSSLSILSRRASTPATAWVRNDPHRAAIAQNNNSTAVLAMTLPYKGGGQRYKCGGRRYIRSITSRRGRRVDR